MENISVKMTISDYRALLTHYAKSDIRKIKLTGPDLPSIFPQFRDEISEVASPATILLSMCVPSAEDIPICDVVSILQIAVGKPNDSPTIIWGLKEMPNFTNICVTAYLGYKNPQ